MSPLTIHLSLTTVAVITVLGLGLLAWIKNPRSPVNRYFGLYNVFLAVWNSADFLMVYFRDRPPFPLLADRVTGISGLAFIATSLLFYSSFAGDNRPSRLIRFIVYIVTPVWMVLVQTPLVIKDLQVDDYGIAEIPGPLFVPFGLFMLWGMLYGIFRLMLLYPFSDSKKRAQIHYMMAGFGVGFFGVMTYTFWNLVSSTSAPIMYLFESGYSALFAYAILKHGALDIRTVIHKTLMWAVLSSLVLLPLFLTLWMVRRWLEAQSTWVVSLVALGLFYATTVFYKTIQPRIDHLFQRRKYDQQQVLDRLLSRLSVLGEVRDLSRQIAGTLSETLYSNPALVWLADDKAGGFRVFDRTGIACNAEVTARFSEWLRTPTGIGATRLFESQELPVDLMADAREFQERTRAEVLVPLMARGEFVGMILLGPKTNLKPYNQLDLQLLEKLRIEAAIALSNALLYDRVVGLNLDLAQLNAQLEDKIRERTADLETANTQLVASNQQIAAADRAKTRFLANMSHELRTPLNSIIGFSRVMLKGIDGLVSERQREDLEAIHHSGQHLLGLITDLLDLSKIEAGKMDLAQEPVDLEEIIRGVLSTAQALVKDKSVELKVSIAPQLPPLMGDGLRLRQVVLNLVSNAIKFTDHGEVEVRVESRNGHIVVSVRDTGCGISEELKGRLFREFEQAEGSRGGTGLGLAISRELIHLHGGEIWCDSQPGEGSTFSFSVPAGASSALFLQAGGNS